MSRTTRYLLGMLLVIIITCLLQWMFCCNKTKNEVTSNITTPVAVAATKNPFSIADANGNFSLNSNDNFNFKGSTANFLTPLSPDVDVKIDKLKNYLLNNKGKKITVKGYYTSEEKNNTSFENLGLARAYDVKAYLVKKGIPADSIIPAGEMKDNMIPDTENVFYGPVKFEITEGEKSIDLNSLLKEINSDPLIFYFNTGEFYTSVSSVNQEKINKISTYLNKAKKGNCIVEGHTDNVGSISNNIALGKRRANFGRNILAKNNIPKNSIKIISKGLSKPAYSNENEEGRAKNRRTIITIK